MKTTLKKFRGTTLIELMVAMAITAILVIFLASMLDAAMKSWRAGSSMIKKNMDARAAFEVIKQDFESMVIARSPSRPGWEWFQLQQFGNIGTSGVFQAPNAAQVMFFATPLDANSQEASNPGNLCAVCYKLAWQDPVQTALNAGTPTGNQTTSLFALYRTVLPSTTTFSSVLGQTDLYTDYWNSSTSISNSIVSPRNFLIGNVVNFNVMLTVKDSSNATVTSSSPQFTSSFFSIPTNSNSTTTDNAPIYIGDSITTGNTTNTITNLATNALANKPSVVFADLTLSVISDDAASTIQQSLVGTNSSNSSITGKIKTFTERISFPPN